MKEFITIYKVVDLFSLKTTFVRKKMTAICAVLSKFCDPILMSALQTPSIQNSSRSHS